MSQSKIPGWIPDPNDPRAPSQEIWDRLTPQQRAQVLDALPSHFEPTEASPPEGDRHTDQVFGARDVLRSFFRRHRRRIYVGNNLPVYYPNESMFAPDVIAVLDVEDHARDHWTVSHEGKGLDFAMEVLWRGRSRKDLHTNVVRYAALGIREYFVFDARRSHITAMRLPDTGGQVYQPIVPQAGRYASEVLGLEAGIDSGRLRFYVDTAPLPFSDELIAKLSAALDNIDDKLEQEAQRAEQEAQRAEQEAQRADAAEHKLAEALAEIERLKRER
jgi:Uma2 family endonuclease